MTARNISAAVMDGRRRRLTRAAATRRRQARLGVARLVTHFSGRHTYAQIISPAGKVLASASTMSKSLRAEYPQFAKNGGNIAAAEAVGAAIAKKAAGIAGIELGKLGKLGFDRGGRQYAGRVRAMATAARAGGLKF